MPLVSLECWDQLRRGSWVAIQVAFRILLQIGQLSFIACARLRVRDLDDVKAKTEESCFGEWHRGSKSYDTWLESRW